ncbi:MAG: hypothetical protein ABTR07_15295 [Candidatus Competibacter denitrificans]
MSMDREDIALATFALGRFVQYRLDDGMAESDLEPFMQAYFNLTADLDGRERLSLHALRSQTTVEGPVAQAEGRPEWPSWLIPHEIRRSRHFR